MPHVRGESLRVHAGGDRQTREGVTGIVKGDRIETSLPPRAPRLAARGRGIERRAVRARENEILLQCSLCSTRRSLRAAVIGIYSSGPRRQVESHCRVRPDLDRADAPQSSPSPCTAWQSPRQKNAPSTAIGSKTRHPGPISCTSRFPPWGPLSIVLIESRRGAVAITPTMGLTGMRVCSSQMTWPSRTSTTRAWTPKSRA